MSDNEITAFLFQPEGGILKAWWNCRAMSVGGCGPLGGSVCQCAVWGLKNAPPPVFSQIKKSARGFVVSLSAVYGDEVLLTFRRLTSTIVDVPHR